jgi:hypothetical protein
MQEIYQGADTAESRQSISFKGIRQINLSPETRFLPD